MKTIKAVLEYEKDAPKSLVYGVRTKDGVLIKVWVPKALQKKVKGGLPITIELSGAKGKNDDFEDDSDEIDEDEEDDATDGGDEDEQDEDEEPPKRKRSRR